jgi:anti-sigma-K factor RskA
LNFKNKPELHERLAAEYVLGTLRGAARARFRRWLLEDAALARAVSGWEARLAPMAESVAAVRPPARVWREIEARLGGSSEARLGPAKAAAGDKGALWRALGLVAAGAAAAFVFMTVLMPQALISNAGYIAVLSDPKTQKPVLIASVRRNDTTLRLKTLDPSIQVADASLQLWALPKGGKPKSLGLVSGDQSVLRLAAVADKALADVPMLAISLEPKGGSPTGSPTGPVLYAGPCVKDW